MENVPQILTHLAESVKVHIRYQKSLQILQLSIYVVRVRYGRVSTWVQFMNTGYSVDCPTNTSIVDNMDMLCSEDISTQETTTPAPTDSSDSSSEDTIDC